MVPRSPVGTSIHLTLCITKAFFLIKGDAILYFIAIIVHHRRMPRSATNVFPEIPHHITQRGNRREDIFFTDDDRHAYLNWLGDYSKEYQALWV